MNKQHECLKFTSEAENDNSFLFLDIKITRHKQQFMSSNLKQKLRTCFKSSLPKCNIKIII